jgi:nondiscriminating glutamyl-tRNA synthetase
LGSSFAKGKEIFTREDMTRQFSLEKTGRGGAVFDIKKLKWINRTYIRNCATDRLAELLLPFMSNAGYNYNSVDMEWLYKVVDAVKTDISTLAEIGDHVHIFFDDHFEISEDALAILHKKDTMQVIRAVYKMLKSGVTDYRTIMETTQSETGFHGKALFMPVRVAVTGRTRGPELDTLFSVLGRKTLMNRIDNVLEINESR